MAAGNRRKPSATWLSADERSAVSDSCFHHQPSADRLMVLRF